MQSLDQLAESVVGKVDGERETLGVVGSGGDVEVLEDGAQLALVEPNDQEFPSLYESQKQKKKGRGRPPKGLVGSIAPLGVLEADARQPRVASQGSYVKFLA
ncbi:hypothetical protein V6N12_051678 [Hibiscus sabdariffa]|uniref:Uncharacterized protein n=1 Tax=Hibiscus sabdariffa TaxID=183260 RepID=A0ABR2GG24_9ROSI